MRPETPLRAEYISIPDSQVKDAAWWVNRIRSLAVIEQEMTARTGRPNANSLRSLLALAHIATAQGGISQMHLIDWEIVSEALTPAQRDMIGLTNSVTIQAASRTLESLSRRLRGCDADGVAYDDALSVSTDTFVNDCLDASIPDGVKRTTTWAIDATDVPAWSEGRTPSAFCPLKPAKGSTHTNRQCGHPHSLDPDADYGHRTASAGQSKLFFGYHAHLATTVVETPGERSVSFACGMNLVPAGDSSAEAGLDLIDMLREHQAVHHVITDRGYSIAHAENWATPLAQRHITQSMDLTVHEQKRKPGPIPGTILIAGGLFSAGLPTDLLDLTRPDFQFQPEIRIEYRELFERRAQYAFTPFSKATARGAQRYRGPAFAGREKVRCVNWPASMKADPRLPLTSCTPGKPCHCGATVTLRDENLRDRQPNVYGTRAWERDYGRRNAIENVNSVLKVHHGKLDRSSIRLRGRDKYSVALMLMVAAANMSLFRSRYQMRPHEADTFELKPPPTKYRPRKRKPTSAPILTNAPPAKKRQPAATSFATPAPFTRKTTTQP